MVSRPREHNNNLHLHFVQFKPHFCISRFLWREYYQGFCPVTKSKTSVSPTHSARKSVCQRASELPMKNVYCRNNNRRRGDDIIGVFLLVESSFIARGVVGVAPIQVDLGGVCTSFGDSSQTTIINNSIKISPSLSL